MNKLQKNLEQSSEFRLTKAEKDATRNALVHFIEKHPVRAGGGFRHLLRRPFTFIPLPRIPMPALALLLIFLTGFGASAAAQGALPGDTLYPVKVGVNEEVRSWFALSTESKAKFDAALAARRLEEAEKLAIRGELTDDTRAAIAERFQFHSGRAEDRVRRLQEESRFDAALDANGLLEAVLRAHEPILDKLKISLKNTVRGEVEAAVKQRAHIESRLPRGPGTTTSVFTEAQTEAAVRGKLTAAINVIAEVTRFLERHKSELSVEATLEAQAALDKANESVADGKTKLEAKAYAGAFLKFQEAEREAHQAQSLIRTLIELSAEVEHDQRIDFLAPAPPTQADRSERDNEGRGRGERPEPRAEFSGEADAQVQIELRGKPPPPRGEVRGRGEGRVEVELGL